GGGSVVLLLPWCCRWRRAAVVVLMVSSERWWRCSGGYGTVATRGVGDRVDRGTSNLFGFAEKIPPEKFSGGGRVAAAGRPKFHGDDSIIFWSFSGLGQN
nr:hypothetical protein [Tanacetum cinerariifolium]